jgi:hypothetical protein
MRRPYLIALLTFIFIFLTISIGWAQTNKNDIQINVGASSGYGYPNGLTETENSGIPTLNLSIDYSLSKIFSVGIYGAYTYSFSSDKVYNSQSDYKVVWRGLDIGARATFHISSLLTKNGKADLYLIAFSGYTSRALVYDKSNIYRDSLNYKVDAFNIGGILGFRYLITQKIGLYGETGVSRKFFLGAGISFKINCEN